METEGGRGRDGGKMKEGERGERKKCGLEGGRENKRERERERERERVIQIKE